MREPHPHPPLLFQVGHARVSRRRRCLAGASCTKSACARERARHVRGAARRAQQDQAVPPLFPALRRAIGGRRARRVQAAVRRALGELTLSHHVPSARASRTRLSLSCLAPLRLAFHHPTPPSDCRDAHRRTSHHTLRILLVIFRYKQAASYRIRRHPGSRSTTRCGPPSS